MKNRFSKGAALRAVAVPAVVLLGVGSGLLISAPAFADDSPTATATSTSTAEATEAPAAAPTTAPTTTSTAAPTSPAAPTGTAATGTAPTGTGATGTAPTGTTTTAAPTASKPPKDLIVTSPISTDYETPLPSRSFDVVGRAPAGSKIRVTDDNDTLLGTATANTTGDFSIPITFSDDVTYDQYLYIDGKAGSRVLSEQFVEVYLPAETSVAPVIESPVTGDEIEAAPLPFHSGAVVTFSGTGTPGENVALDAEPVSTTDDDDDYSYSTSDIVVDDAGKWSGTISISYGRWSFSATSELDDADYYPLTYTSDPSNTVLAIIAPPADYVAPPTITTPSDPDGIFSSTASASPATASSSSFSTSSTGIAAASVSNAKSMLRSHPEALKVAGSRPTQAGYTALQRAGFDLPKAAATDPENSDRVAAVKALDSLPSADPVEGDGTTPVLTEAQAKELYAAYDDIIREYGIHVKGKSDPTDPGNLLVTVAGTGTPGDGIQVYAAKPSTAFPYFQGLYPDYFASNFGVLFPNAPASTVPASDGRITVAANGRWTTVVSVPKGQYLLTAFAVDKTDPAALQFSVAGDLLPVDVTGTPAVVTVAAAPGTTLAFTGSNTEGPFWAALALLGGGAALLVSSVRRRRGSIG